MLIDEHRAYNALALIHRGDYHALTKARLAGGSWVAAYDRDREKKTVDPEKAWKELVSGGISLILQHEQRFPELLREMPWAPHALYLRGAPLTAEPKIAIVGTRKATALGLSTAEDLAKGCARAGVTIVSGLAFGIDVAAHRATLEIKGRAIAVLASGLDRITPRSNEEVGQQIVLNGGTLLSEYPIGTRTLPRFFIERNRIVSGLSLGIIVIEAPERSGTLSTTRFAIDQNREVFVVPGSVNNPNYAGSHALIKSGATLVTSAEDVLNALDLLPETAGAAIHAQPLPFLDETEARIVEVVRSAGSPISVDVIAEQTKLGIAVINEALAILTIEGVVREGGGAYHL